MCYEELDLALNIMSCMQSCYIGSQFRLIKLKSVFQTLQKHHVLTSDLTLSGCVICSQQLAKYSRCIPPRMG